MHTNTKNLEHKYAETVMFSLVGIMTGILFLNLTTSAVGVMIGYATLVVSAIVAAGTLATWIPLMRAAYRRDNA